MKVIGDAPEWATELFTTVCKDYNRGLPSEFIWRKRNDRYSSGSTNSHWYSSLRYAKNGKKITIKHYGHVIVRAGYDDKDARLVLLHELAHYICGRSKTGRGQGHTIKFWKLAFELYERYDVGLEYAYKREKHYKKKATQAYE